jgi:hypothetical protein
VHTARELLDIINGARQQGFQQPGQFPQPGQFSQPAPPPQQGSFAQPTPFPQGTAFPQGSPFPQGTPSPQQGSFPQGTPFPQPDSSQQPGQTQGQGWNNNNNNDDDYDHYNADGNRSGFSFRGNRSRRDGFGLDSIADGLADDIGGAVVGAALGFAGRALAKRMKKAYDEKIAPAMEARSAQAQQQSQQQWEQSKADAGTIVQRYPELRGCLADQLIFLDGGYKTVPMSELTMPVTLAQADAVVTRLR